MNRRNRQIVYVVALLAVTLPGCAGNQPRNSTEFRRAAASTLTAAIESFEVERPITEVAATFRENGPKCLKVKIRTRTKTGEKISEYITSYHPTIRIGSTRAELHLQRQITKNDKTVRGPEGGSYVLVADAIAVGPSRTRIDFYRPASGYNVLAEGIRGWAHGTNLDCPDMTKG